MNEQRRRELRSILNDLDVLSECLSHEANGEDEAHDNMPESLQDTEKGQKLKDNAEKLHEFNRVISGVIEGLDKLINDKGEN